LKANNVEASVRPPTIFTTGAFLVPVKIIRDGVETWRWLVTEFVDDSYYDGEYCDPVEFATEKEKLFSYDSQEESK